jgi:macrodomain Ter protein organizer (MatP/YcbG family)
MRTSISLDEDVYQQATLYARGRGVTLSTAVSEMARKGVEAMQSTSPTSRLKRAPNGLLIFAGGDRVITSEMVKAALEEDDF